MFYTFYQNNSGGIFDGPEYIIIEAFNAEDANYFAENNTPIYFNGVEENIDCSCCGDRWYRTWEDESYISPKVYGKELDISDINTGNVVIYYMNGDIKYSKYKLMWE